MTQVALARRTVTPFGLWVFGAQASAPLVVLVGGIPAIYATTGITALPLTYVLVAGVVAVLAVGYTAMARQVGHPAAYYGILARGLGRGWGVAGGMVALVAYNAIQISLYGLLGATLAAQIGGAWWVWAGIALVTVAAFGRAPIVRSTWLLSVVLVVSLLLVAIFVLAGVMGQASTGDVSWAGFEVSGLMVGGIGGAAAFCVASLMGVDAPGSLVEEAIDKRSVNRASVVGALALGGVYAVAAWAMGVAVGPTVVGEMAAADADLPLTILSRGGSWLVAVAGVMLFLAILTAKLSFHNVIARYVFAMAREGVLPARLAGAEGGTRVSAPRGGSLTQTVTAALVVTGFAAAGADPLAQMFTWLSTLGALGLLSLLLAASLAALLAPPEVKGERAGVWEWRIAPVLGLIAGLLVLAAMVFNVGSLLGAAPGSPFPLLLPTIIIAAAVTGAMWAQHLRQSRPEVYAGIGDGTPQPNAVPDALNISI
ncbi:APC family permease [Micromonospora craniellae]|uniref:APC family permease n=1 Tax=Micromonospora craniellae TaxID=2294034 RepID=A0A372FS51_9ACTN|nr:amino acid permease [Micromonospora craniellae]QOC89652.1 APC family permease [Micromonospora craniellae]RFS43612.1 APC family permease [Micromonospora craniellae]